MSNYDYNDPMRRDQAYDPVAGETNAKWGWLAAAILVVVIIGLAVGMSRQQSGPRTAQNESGPPAVTRMAPPPAASAPITPAPNSPAQRTQP
jgi:hypothetical protein